MEVEAMWTTADVEEYLAIPHRTIDQWAYQKKGPPYYKIGLHRRYKAAEVIAWADAQLIKPRTTS